MRETDLFVPLRDYFESLGYTVHGEVGSCDLVARRGDAMVVVETKMTMSLRLVTQGVRRQQLSDEVYLALPRADARGGYPPNYKDLRLLLHRLGLGLLVVGRRGGVVVAVPAVGPAGRRKDKRLKQSLVAEMERRRLDAGPSGARRNRRMLTAYRQEALLLAAYLAESGPSKPRDAAAATSIPTAQRILYANHYGWFARVRSGVYSLSPSGEQAVTENKGLIQAMYRRQKGPT